MERTKRQVRSILSKPQTREMDTGEFIISGYFSVFGTNYELWPGATESVDQNAFAETMGEDIRALINHDTTLVLGRTKAGTLELKVDERGLYGEIKTNPKDSDAMNLYERVKRGDVDQCSFGFDILDEDMEVNDTTGDVHWTIKKVKLYEVSVVTFPAYEDTAVIARKAQLQDVKKRRLEVWKQNMRKKIGG